MKRTPGSRNARGFSLIEVLISLGIFVLILGVISIIMNRTQRDYLQQQDLLDAQNNARAALDTMVRLIRMAGTDARKTGFTGLEPDPDGDGQLNSIRLRADWNPPDGLLASRYEDVLFFVGDDKLYIQEGNGVPEEFVDRIRSISFSYLDRDNSPIDPFATPGVIASVNVTMNTATSSAMAFSSAATLRLRERHTWKK